MITRHALALGGALVLVAALAGLVWTMSAGRPTRADPGNPELVGLGKTIYVRHCSSCHGRSLEGQPNWRERLPNGRLPAPPHDATGHTWHHPDRQLFEITKNGATGILPGYESDMPGFQEVLSNREIWAVLAYIKSTWPGDIRARQERMNQQAADR
jgi:mono/diheme cytochrome c family protein